MLQVFITFLLLFIEPQVSANPLLLREALKEWGTSELRNPQRVLVYSKECDLHFESSRIPWCGAFACYVVSKAGFESSIPDQAGLARSWLDVGTGIVAPEPGDLVIFWRDYKDGPQGHVGFFVRYSEDGKFIYVLGGNQSNEVGISKYPLSRLIGFRRIK